MESELPEIRIKYAWLLSQKTSVHLNELWGNGKALRSDEEYRVIVDNYIKAWKPYEKQIIESMQRITGLSFRQEIIDIYIAPWFNAFSDPLVIGVIFKPHTFIDILTHELIHRLLTDNTEIPYDTWLLDEWHDLFGKELSDTTVVHIPVHAVHKHIYLDVLKDPKRYEDDKEANIDNKATAYIKSWEYVDKNGYKEIIEKLKKSYKKLAAEAM
jgi:hypothetical protein